MIVEAILAIEDEEVHGDWLLQAICKIKYLPGISGKEIVSICSVMSAYTYMNKHLCPSSIILIPT